MLNALRRWSDARRAIGELRRMRARESAAFSFLIEEKLADATASLEGGDRVRAGRLWDEAMAADPSAAKSSPRTARVLIGLGRLDEAEAVMQAGARQHPRTAMYAEGLAHVARGRGDLDEAIRRWAAVRAAFPRNVAGWRQGAQALMDAGRLEEADALLTHAATRLPPDLLTRIEHARAAALREDWQAALARWDVVAAFGHQSAFAGRAEALRGLGRLDEAERVLAEGRLLFPLESDLAFEHARVAQARGDLPEAARRWGEAARRFPMIPYPYQKEVEAWIATKDDAAASAALERAADRFPDDLWLALARADVAGRRGG